MEREGTTANFGTGSLHRSSFYFQGERARLSLRVKRRSCREPVPKLVVIVPLRTGAGVATTKSSRGRCNPFALVPRTGSNHSYMYYITLIFSQTMDQFEFDGCENCEEFLHMKNNRDAVIECTSANFEGYVTFSNNYKSDAHQQTSHKYF